MDTSEMDALELTDQFYADSPAGRGGGGGLAFAYNLVSQTDKTIAKNNRLALMMELHGKRQGRLAVQPEHPEMEEKMAVKKIGNCDVCDRTKTTVVNVYNKKMCLPCSNAYSAVNVRPAIVVEAIKELNLVDKFTELLGKGTVPVHVESSALKAIAEIVGYDGTDGDQLLEAVRTMAMNAADTVVANGELKRIYDALKIDEGDEAQVDVVIAAIAQLTNTMERYQQQSEDLARIKDEYSITIERLTELEQQLSVNHQVFARLADLVEGNPEHPAELPARYAALLSKVATVSAVGAGRARELLPIPTASPLDSHLLDLLIDHPAIGVDRIAVLREAA